MVMYVACASERDREGQVGGGQGHLGERFWGRDWCLMQNRYVPSLRRGGLVVAGLAERVAQPFETLVQTVTGCGASGLDVLEALLARRSELRILG
jgi:hypothetical protein